MTIDPAALRSLLAAATPGPWDSKGCGFGDGNKTIGFTNGFQDDTVTTFAKAAHNAALICAAVNALPHLLAVYEAACTYSKAVHERPYGHVNIDFAAHALLSAVDAARKGDPNA